MTEAAQKVGFPFPGAYSDKFDETDLLSNLPPKDKFLLTIADDAAEALMPELIDAAIAFADDSKLPLPTQAGQDAIKDSFRMTVPASSATSFADVIGAAWSVYLAPDFWNKDTVPAERRFDVLNELTLKTIEVLEFEARNAASQ
jgi:hypothetical protein